MRDATLLPFLEPIVEVSRYTVSCVPQDHHLAVFFTLYVTDRGSGKWAVTRVDSHCLSTSGQWDPELRPDCRPDGWDIDHRFDRAAALRLAKQAAPEMTAKGVTVAEVLARRAGAGR